VAYKVIHQKIADPANGYSAIEQMKPIDEVFKFIILLFYFLIKTPT
jgi:hypothetical protein